MSFKNKTSLLRTQAFELVKQYIERDPFDRPIRIYTAATDAEHGVPCTMTEYTYAGDSLEIEKMKESEVLWDSLWDL